MYINPYSTSETDEGQWLRSNFHTHAGTGIGTCGEYEIDDVVKMYKAASYDVMSISNHDKFSDVSEYAIKHDILLINGFEYSQDEHMLCIGGDSEIFDNHQNAIDECKRQGGFVILCHPNWIKKEYWPRNKIDELKGYTGIEIFNSVIFRLSGTGLATDTWDYLLSQGKLVWGFGNDDFHRWYDSVKTWNKIYSVRNKDAVQSAIYNGNFYVSTGLSLTEFKFENGILRISACAGKTYVNDNKYIFIGKDGQVLKEQCGEYGEYKLSGDEMYVRVQVVSEHGAMLWMQPVYDENQFIRP